MSVGTATVNRTVPLRRITPHNSNPSSAPVLWMRFTHTSKCMVKWWHSPNNTAIEFSQDLKEFINHMKVSNRQTYVEVYRGQTLVTSGMAYCWVPDPFSKAVGRRNALLNATLNMTRAERKEIFTAYNALIEKSKTKKKETPNE